MLASIIRTVVPALVGLVLSWPVVAWLGLSRDQVTWLVTGAITAAPVVLQLAYYLTVRLIERRWPSAGALLGRRGAPTYSGKHAA